MNKAVVRSAAVSAGVAAVTLAGVASAAWSVSGTASQQTTNGHAGHVLALGVTATLPSDIFPTDSFSQDLSVTNPNVFKVSLNQVSVAGYSSSTADCQTALTALGDSQKAGLITVANNFGDGVTAVIVDKHTGGNGTDAVDGSATYPTTVSVSNDLPDACQDADLTVNFKVQGVSTS